MSIRFANVAVTFDSATAGPLGFRNVARSVTIPDARAILRAQVAINGFAINYTHKDHHVRSLLIDTDLLRISNETEVEFQVQVALKDKKPDDPYEGWVSVLVIAEVEDLPTVPEP